MRVATMNEQLRLDLLSKTLEDLSVGVGIFYVPDLEDTKSIEYYFMNTVLLAEMGKTKEEVIGKRIMEVAPEAFEHKQSLIVLETYRRIAKEGGEANLGLVPYSNIHVGGIYECSVHAIQEHYAFVQLRNVTALERAKEELQEKKDLERKNKELQEFTYITSHDLQEPLNSIISFSQLLEEEQPQDTSDIFKECVRVISSSAMRMKNFIFSLLEYSRIGHETGKSEIDIRALVEELKTDLNELIINTQTLIVYIGAPIKVEAFRADFYRLFQNLIVNAIKYTAKDVNPEIEIDVQELKGSFKFSIKDNGIGIGEKYHESIFEVFKRLHNRDDYPGTGIGLAQCKKIVELHGGDIWVNSEEGKGSTFYFTILK